MVAKMSVTSLELVKPGNAERLLPLIAEFNAAEGIDTPPSRTARALERLLADSSLGRAWFILFGGSCVGYIVLTFGYDLEYGGRDAWITDFYVREEFQGRGVGTQAVAALEQEARKLQICALHLMVRDSNRRAIKVYEKQGFGRNPRTAMIKMLADPEQ